MRSQHPVAIVVAVAMALPASTATAFDCDSWQRVSPLPTLAGLNGVASGDPGMVAVGDGGAMLFSADEVGWEEIHSPAGAALNAVAWARGLFVAVGSGGAILTSSDGEEWQAVDLPLSSSLHAVAAGPDAWVAVGESGTVVRSDDGLQWEVMDTPGDSLLRAVAWRGSEFLAAGHDRVLLSSPDGRDWQAEVVDDLPDIVWGLAAHGTTTVLAGHYHSFISDDGRHWTELDDLESRLVRAVTWTGEDFAAVLANGSFALRSADGLDWEWLGSVFCHEIEARAIAASPRGLVVVGEGGAMGFFADGEHTQALVSGLTTVPLEAVAAARDTVVAVGGDGWPANAVILTSSRGAAFASTYEFSHEKLLDAVATDAGFVVAGGITELLCGPILMFSDDGWSWSGATIVGDASQIPCEYEALAAAGRRVVAVGEGRSAVSVDGGASWTAAVVDEGWNATAAVATDGTLFVAVGASGHSYTSSNGLAWEKHENSLGSGSFRTIAWGDGRFLAAADNGTVLASSDGASWSDTGAFLVARDLIWADGRFVAVAGGMVSSSLDGVHWASTQVAGVQPLRGVAWDGGDLIVVGGWGLVARSTCGLTSDGPVADFSWLPTAVTSNLPVRFWDLSAGDISSRHWTFGDGGWSDRTNPTHTFTAPGDYLVTLQVSGDGAASLSRQVHVAQGPDDLDHVLYLPGVAHLPGFNATLWRSDVEVCSFGHGEEAFAEIALLLRDQANPDPLTVTRTIQPGTCTRFSDVVGSLFGSTAAGALRIASNQPLQVNGRTFNETPAGSFGSFKTATDRDHGIAAYEAWVISHLSQSADPDTGFRTNLGLLNLGDEPAVVEVQLYRADGAPLGVLQVDLAAHEYTQVLQALLPFAPAGVDDAFALVRTETMGARFLASASLVDNVSGDGAAIPALQIAP